MQEVKNLIINQIKENNKSNDIKVKFTTRVLNGNEIQIKVRSSNVNLIEIIKETLNIRIKQENYVHRAQRILNKIKNYEEFNLDHDLEWMILCTEARKTIQGVIKGIRKYYDNISEPVNDYFDTNFYYKLRLDTKNFKVNE